MRIPFKIRKRDAEYLPSGIIIFLLLFFIPLSTSSYEIDPVNTLPALAGDNIVKLIPDSFSAGLTVKLREEICRNELWAELISKKRFAVGLVRLSDIYHPRAAVINGDQMMYAASLPKIAVLLAAVKSMEEGEIPESPDVLQDLKDMIRKSDNCAATRIIERISLKKIEDTVTSPEYKFFDAENGGGLWVGKKYSVSGALNPDPIKGLSHAATVNQVCRFYYLLATGRLLNPGRSKQMLEILSMPYHHHKFVNHLAGKYPLNRIYRKSGTWHRWHADSVLVWGSGENERYILVGLVEHPGGERILRELVSAVEKVL